MSAEWPPLVGVGAVPWWVRLRDVVLTILAWALLLWMMRHLRVAIWLGLQGVSLQPRWDLFLPFAGVIALLAALILVIALSRRRTLRAQPRAFAEPRLDPALHAVHFGLDLQQLQALRSGPIRHVTWPARAS